MWLSPAYAAFGKAVLEIIPLRLCIGPSSAARPLSWVGLDRQRATLFFARFRANRDCLVWMSPVSANKVDPASANAMSGPRVSDDCVHGCLSDLTVFGGRNEPARQMNRNPPKTASQLEEPPANQNGGLTPLRRRLQSLLLDGCSVYCL